MRQHRHKPAVVILALLGMLMLVGCTGSASTNSANPLATNDAPQIGPPAPDDLVPTDSVALVYDPTDGSLLKANRDGPFRWHADSGWQSVNVSQTFGISGIAVNPDQPTTMCVSNPGVSVIRSDDDGRNWRPVNTGLPNLDVSALALHSFRRETLYVWLKGDGIYRTEDGGANWKRMPDQGPPDTDVRGLTHSTLEGSMNTGWLYAATPTGTYLSMDCF